MHPLYSGTRVSSSERGSTHTYPYIEENPCGPARTHKKTCKDADSAITAGNNVSVCYKSVGKIPYIYVYSWVTYVAVVISYASAPPQVTVGILFTMHNMHV